ncbi:uncharacterized protein [Haliotis cracherodii]|uniref:uncharacterized protein n=1 Tax=Haliotis cracherodii TaxID=6455 RepID=UPI0039E8AD9D
MSCPTPKTALPSATTLQIGWQTALSFVPHMCRTCADTRSDSPCKHTDEERSWVVTYATVELHEAVKKYCYKVLQIFDVWHFNTFAQHDPNTQQEGLFDTYIDRHFKEKLEASGYPGGCTDHDAYIQEIYDKEGIRLDKDHIEKNPGLGTIANLFLNSLWGKFGQRLDYMNVYMNDPAQYFALWRDEQNTIEDDTVVNEHMVEVTYTHKEEFQTPHFHFNVAIAAWVTTQARLKLYKTLALVGCRVLYFDTDSVIYIHRPHDTNPELGHSLGELTDALDRNTIKTFVSGGPKDYDHELMNPRPDGTRTTCRVRGFTLNYRNQQHLNFDTMKGLILGQRPGKEGEKISLDYPHQIIRKGHRHGNTRKDCRTIYNKRRLVYDETTGLPVDTLPFGYRDDKIIFNSYHWGVATDQKKRIKI